MPGQPGRLAELRAELGGYVPAWTETPEHLGFAVPLRLATPHGKLRLMTTITTFDVTSPN